MHYLFTYILCFVGCLAISQNKQILYGFDDIPQSLMLNPGLNVTQKKHFGIPLLSQIHFNGGATGVTAYDIFKSGNDDINDRIRRKIFEMKSSDFFTATLQLELINFGWRAKNEIYFSGGIYEELDFISYFPRDLAILAWEGNQDYLDYPFNLGEISTTGDLTTVFHFGANKQISDKLTVGARFKIYSSMFSFRSVNNTGTFTTRLGGSDSENIYEHIVQNADVTVETSGYAPLRDLDGSSEVTSEIFGRALFGGNLGVGVDLGFTYKIGDAWTLSASALDVGAIFHTKDVETYRAHGTYTLDGINLVFPPLSEGESTFPYYDDLEDDIAREVSVDTLNTTYTQFRPLKLNVALSYGFGRFNSSGACDCLNMGGEQLYRQNVGLQLYTIFRPRGPQLAGTLFYHRRVTNFLSAKATYTVDSYSFKNVGLGVSADIGIVNLYLAADNLMSYGNLAKAKSVSLQLGFNLIFDEE
ncbi:DUF5723 family protein [Aequorivita sp. F47161]|uniref:DUF5723 family protein n=1 Tax=Aequorivita vitellina TaxID=2874475 RepID=A0A9X1U9F2_9FLAO|nr:DUF5723 family protein [Aequorivita vitellina]MCG2418461.1 DUF5723 family protein [Aequorivita vitellina]